jgi:hypothetical protein
MPCTTRDTLQTNSRSTQQVAPVGVMQSGIRVVGSPVGGVQPRAPLEQQLIRPMASGQVSWSAEARPVLTSTPVSSAATSLLRPTLQQSPLVRPPQSSAPPPANPAR